MAPKESLNEIPKKFNGCVALVYESARHVDALGVVERSVSTRLARSKDMSVRYNLMARCKLMSASYVCGVKLYHCAIGVALNNNSAPLVWRSLISVPNEHGLLAPHCGLRCVLSFARSLAHSRARGKVTWIGPTVHWGGRK